MLGWTGIVMGYKWCQQNACLDMECSYVVEWTVPETGQKAIMTHFEVREIPPLVYIAEQSR